MSIIIEQRGSTLHLTLSNPAKKNALTGDMLEVLRDTLIATAYDTSIRVVVLTGDGDAFCSGADLAGLRPEGTHPLESLRLAGEVTSALVNLPQPVIARVQGVAIGAGANLVLACDIVVASETARFSQMFVRRGLSMDAGGSWLLPRAVGMLQAKRLALLGGTIDAAEAAAIGLVTFLFPATTLDAEIEALCEELTANSPMGLAQTKTLLNRASAGSLEQALAHEAACQVVNHGTDAAEARRAFFAREEPVFTGKWRVVRLDAPSS